LKLVPRAATLERHIFFGRSQGRGVRFSAQLDARRAPGRQKD
jgi:hypothetical protein